MWSRFAGSRAIGTIKRLVCIPLAFMAISANAQMIELAANTDYWDGTIMAVEIPNPTSVKDANGGVAQNLLPVMYILTRKANEEWGGGFTTSISMEQVSAYHAAANQFYSIGPRTIVSYSSVVSKVAGSNSGTNASEPSVAARFFAAFQSAPYNTDEYKWGKFRLRIRVNPSNTGFVDAVVHEFIVTPRGYTNLIDVNNGDVPGGGGISQEDLNDQPINQSGFWEGIFDNLFIPQQETLDTLQDLLVSIGHWGPFGLLASIKSLLDSHSGGPELELQFTLPPTYLLPAGWTINLEPYETYVLIARTIMAMVLWWYFVWHIWAKLIRRMAVSG